MTNNFEDLVHSGKKGMKWGVRNSVSSDRAAVNVLKKRRAKSLSDSELKQVIGRMNLEKQYKDIKYHPGALDRANKISKIVLATAATIGTVVTFANSPAGKAVISGVQGAFSKVKNPAVALGLEKTLFGG